MSDVTRIDDATLKRVIERATHYQQTRRSSLTRDDVLAIANELGLDDDLVRRALNEVQDEQIQERRWSQRGLHLGLIVAMALLALWFFSMPDGERLPVQESEPASKVLRAEERTRPQPKVTPSVSKAISLAGTPELSASALHGVWRLMSYQVVMDGRSLEVPLKLSERGAKEERETWTFRADGTFTHRYSATLWFSGTWRLGERAVVPEPLSPRAVKEVIHLISEEVTTSMMTQRALEHHLVALTSEGQLITWYAGKEAPTMKTLAQGHRFQKVTSPQ